LNGAKMNKKGQVMEGLANLGVGIAVFALVIVIAILVVNNTKDQTAAQGDIANAVCGVNGTTAFNSSCELLAATTTIPGWVGLIVLVAIGAIILGMIAMFGRR